MKCEWSVRNNSKQNDSHSESFNTQFLTFKHQSNKTNSSVFCMYTVSSLFNVLIVQNFGLFMKCQKLKAVILILKKQLSQFLKKKRALEGIKKSDV